MPNAPNQHDKYPLSQLSLKLAELVHIQPPGTLDSVAAARLQQIWCRQTLDCVRINWAANLKVVLTQDDDDDWIILSHRL